MRLLFLFIIFILPIEAKALTIDDGSCINKRIYSAEIDNYTKQVYFWKIFLFDGHDKRVSDFTYGFSFGSKLDCVRERNRKQKWDPKMANARYGQDPNLRAVRFLQIESEEFCKMRPELLIEYCDPGRQDDSSNNSTISSIDKDLSVKEKLIKLKSLLDEGLISQEDYDKKKNELLPKQDDSSNYSTISSIDKDLSLKEKLIKLKSLLDEGLISQEQYDIKSTKILDEF